MIKLIRFVQAPIRVLGLVYYYIEVAFLEGKHDGYKGLARRYNESHFKNTK